MRGVDGVLLIDFCNECSEFKWDCVCSDDDDKKKDVLGSSDDEDDQQVVNPNDTTNWKEFAILPYQDRRKFTLGTKFTSWEDQGEFIFLNIPDQRNRNFDYSSDDDSDSDYDDRWTMRTASLVEISCNNGQYYIMPMRAAHLVVNGQDKSCSCGRHHSSYRLELNFGDRLEISLAPGGLQREKITLLFKERTFKPDVDKDAEKVPQEENNVDFVPGRNHLILSQILTYLPVQSLKCARLVCRDWNELGSRILRKRGYATFTFSYEGGCTTQNVNASMQFYRYIQEMGDAPMPNWTFFLPTFEPEMYPFSESGFNISKHKPGGKYIMDLDWFLHPNRGHHVKRLVLHGALEARFDYKIFVKVVTKLQETLQELTLKIEMNLVTVTGQEIEYQIVTNLQFQQLKTFSFFLVGMNSRQSDMTAFNLAWLAPWASAIRNVDSILINGHSVLSSFLVKHMRTVGPSSYPNLTQVSTPFIHEAGPILDFLLRLEQPLTSLSLPKLVKMQDFQNFEKLVEKNGRTLEHLEFVVSTCGEDGQSGVTLRLPALPKLERLDFWVKRGSDEGVTLIFPGDEASMSYKAHLPSIRSLRIYPTDRNWRVSRFKSGRQYWEKYGGFLDTFLPKKDEEICTTLKYLDIPYEMGRDAYPRGAELPGMFPNVENEFMTKFRKHSPPPPATKGYWLRSKVKK
ncbi:uncharacterized protein LOC110854460 [Folsomia candida]|uniref:uncharacterized protein LOC110854460 n=1 Tax=Folsomia candida TaxID=158441 RepID=UPI000B8FD96B|nr:uncharacterized protein LOC110854460 [Folsomia candida]